MHGHFVLSVLVSLALVASTRAAGPDDPAPAPSFAPNGTVLLNDQAAPSLDPALEAQPVSSGPRHYAYRQYTSQNPADDDGGKCCAEYFGGFGCLWESYCADRHRGCGAAACGSAACGASGCRAMPCYPSLRTSLGLPRACDGCRRSALRVRSHGPGCRGTPCDCGCDAASPAMIGPGEVAPQEVGPTPEPTLAEPEKALEPAPTPVTPDESIQPAPPPTLEAPDAQAVKSASSRRNWQHRRASWLSR